VSIAVDKGEEVLDPVYSAPVKSCKTSMQADGIDQHDCAVDPLARCSDVLVEERAFDERDTIVGCALLDPLHIYDEFSVVDIVRHDVCERRVGLEASI
jgi:hypothetical protein